MGNDCIRSRQGRCQSKYRGSASKGNFAIFEELFADDFVDHTPQPDMNNPKWNRQVINVVRLCWSAAGALLVLISAMNYFTHIGLLMNTSDSL